MAKDPEDKKAVDQSISKVKKGYQSIDQLFEWGFPHWDHRFLADGYDVAAYGLGSAG